MQVIEQVDGFLEESEDDAQPQDYQETEFVEQPQTLDAQQPQILETQQTQILVGQQPQILVGQQPAIILDAQQLQTLMAQQPQTLETQQSQNPAYVVLQQQPQSIDQEVVVNEERKKKVSHCLHCCLTVLFPPWIFIWMILCCIYGC